MKLFVTGATGVVGRPAVRGLVEAGHEVRAVARRPEAAEELRASGAEPVSVDLFDTRAVVDAVEGCEGVAHLATHVPALGQMVRPSAWSVHNKLRTDATRALVEAARTHGVTTFVKESITFMYADGGDRWLDEDAPLQPNLGMLAPTKEGEDLALALGGPDIRAVVLRFGSFYGGRGNRGTDEALKLAHLRSSTVLGRGSQYISTIHADDAGTAVVAAVGAPSGIYNVVDDEPLTKRAYLDVFAEAMGTGRLHPVPALVPGAAARALGTSQRVSNLKLRETTGWSPAYPSAREGWAEVAATRRAEESARG
jgi:nucleoside-diphosphate-sugar epimerase